MTLPKIKWSTAKDGGWHTITAEISIGSARYMESRCVHEMEMQHSYGYNTILACVIDRMQNNILDVLGEADKDDVCCFDMEKIQASIDSGTIRLPSGLAREEMRKWMRDNMGNTDD